MTLLKQYVNAVRMYLPKGPQQDDILSELSEHLQSKMDEEEEALGRPLTEVEQEALLTRYGNPSTVAERYGAPRRSVAFGWQLIGPELFPLFARILLLNWTITITSDAGVDARTRFRFAGVFGVHGPALLGSPRAVPHQRRSARRNVCPAGLNWLQAITRLITNSSALLLLYPFVIGFPYVLAAASAPDPEKAELLAHRINSTLWWVTLGTMSIYWLFNAAFHAWLCAQFLRYAGRRRAEQFS
jgi:hypothetical protein